MLDYGVSFGTLLVTAIVAQIVGFLWWGPLFGAKWASLMGMSAKDMKKAKEKGMAKPMLVMLISNIIMAYVLSSLFFATATVGMNAALMLTFWVWLGFVATIKVGSVLWENRPVALFWLNSIGWLVTMLAMAVVLTF